MLEGIHYFKEGVNGSRHSVWLGQCESILSGIDTGQVDLVFTSPPYEAQRTYGIGFNLKGEDFIEWLLPIYLDCYRACKGLTAFVLQGPTNQFRWSASPALLISRLHELGVGLRNPPIYARNGIPGSGSVDWFASRYEWIIAASHGRLPWSDNTAMGHPPKCGPGGSPSHRTKNGQRVGCRSTDRRKDGSLKKTQYKPPKLSNPGNIIDCGSVGGGNMGSKFAHKGEAAFPEKLVEFFIRSCCPPGGTVLDPFCGTGTVASVAARLGRNSISIDCRESQCEITSERIIETLSI